MDSSENETAAFVNCLFHKFACPPVQRGWVLSVLKCPVLSPCAVDGRSRNPLYCMNACQVPHLDMSPSGSTVAAVFKFSTAVCCQADPLRCSHNYATLNEWLLLLHGTFLNIRQMFGLRRSRHANSLAVFFSWFTTPCDGVRWLSHQDLRCVSALLCLMTFGLFDAYRMCWFFSATLWNAQQSIQSLEACSWKWFKKMCLSNCGAICCGNSVIKQLSLALQSNAVFHIST